MKAKTKRPAAGALLLVAGVLRLAAAKAEDGLILKWGFDEVRGGTVEDLSGNGNDGRISGEVGWVPGVSGKAMRFDGDLGSVWCDDNPALNPSNLTVMFWLCPKAWGPANTLLDKGWAKGWGIDPHYPGGGLHWCANIGAQRKDAAAPAEIPLNRWTHVAVTYDGRQTAIYVDGEKKNEVRSGGGLSSRACKLRLGGMTEAVCDVDEVKIYSCALGLGAVRASFEAVRPGGNGRVVDARVERAPGARRRCENLTVNGIPLISGKSANGVIVLDAQAPEITEAAVKELNRHLKRMFAVEMPVVRAEARVTREDPALKGRNLLVVGESGVARACGFTADALRPDGFMIASKENVLAIVGKDDAGARLERMVSGSAGSLYGVYRFLEALGVRWYFPGEDGAVLPSLETVSADDLKVTDAPYFIFRFGHAPPGADARWMRRIGFGGTVFPASTCHCF